MLCKCNGKAHLTDSESNSLLDLLLGNYTKNKLMPFKGLDCLGL